MAAVKGKFWRRKEWRKGNSYDGRERGGRKVGSRIRVLVWRGRYKMEEKDGEIQDLQSSTENQEEGGDESLFVGGEENVLKFLDSTDAYLTLMNALSSGLRQGWMELASARHSMGASRVNAAFFDLKDHSASTTLPVGSDVEQPLFSLHKWTSSQNPKNPSENGTFENDEPLQNFSDGQETCKKDPPMSLDMQERVAKGGSHHSAVDQAQKERSKLLSMFGTLVSPKLRSAQLSFETVLETVAEIANARASLLCAYDLVQKDMKKTLD